MTHVAKYLEKRHFESDSQSEQVYETDASKYAPWTYPFTIFCKKGISKDRFKYCLLPGKAKLSEIQDAYKPIMTYPNDDSLELFFTFNMPP